MPFTAIPAGGVHGVALGRALFNAWQLVRGFFAALRLLRRERPAAVLTTGGYVSVPVAAAARTPAPVAREAGTTALFLAAWGLGGLVSLVGALTFAEIGSRRPRAGGYYKVVADCYHPMLAFMLNWAQALMQGAGAAGVATAGAGDGA